MTDFPLPQLPSDYRQVARRFVDDGAGAVRAEFGQVEFNELDFAGPFGGKVYSGTENTLELGRKIFTLDQDDDRIAPGCTIQIVSLDDPICWGWASVIGKKYDPGPAQIEVYMSMLSPLRGTFSNWEIQILSGPFLGVESETTAVSSTPNVIGFGQKTFETQPGKFFMADSSLLIRDLSSDGYMYGVVAVYSGTTLIIDVSHSAGGGFVSNTWSIRLLDGPGISTGGGEVDDSLPEDWGSILDAAPGPPAGDMDYRLIAEPVTSTEDFELVTAAHTESDDYGSVITVELKQ